MKWKDILNKLEQTHQWDSAIDLMLDTIKNYPNDIDAYLLLNYLIMNLLVEEEYDFNKHNYYEQILKNSFRDSYQRFPYDPEYLFFTGFTATIFEPFMGISSDQAEDMLFKASELDPKNLLYQWPYYLRLDLEKPQNLQRYISYGKQILDENSPIQKQLKSKGKLGKYLSNIMVSHTKEVFEKYKVNI